MLHLKQLLFPEVRIDLPNRAGQGGYAEQAERLKILDHNQEALARQFDGGHRIIVGASGSGKTLVLAHKAGFPTGCFSASKRLHCITKTYTGGNV